MRRNTANVQTLSYVVASGGRGPLNGGALKTFNKYKQQ